MVRSCARCLLFLSIYISGMHVRYVHDSGMLRVGTTLCNDNEGFLLLNGDALVAQ
jgi:hypothetical protein